MGENICKWYDQMPNDMISIGASHMAQWVKNLSTMQETQVWFLSWEDSLEEGMATHASILAWRIPWTEEPGGLQSIELQESDMTKANGHELKNDQY